MENTMNIMSKNVITDWDGDADVESASFRVRCQFIGSDSDYTPRGMQDTPITIVLAVESLPGWHSFEIGAVALGDALKVSGTSLSDARFTTHDKLIVNMSDLRNAADRGYLIYRREERFSHITERAIAVPLHVYGHGDDIRVKTGDNVLPNGYAFTTLSAVNAKYGWKKFTAKRAAEIRARIEAEVVEFSAFLRGEVYEILAEERTENGWRLTEDWLIPVFGNPEGEMMRLGEEIAERESAIVYVQLHEGL